MNQFFHHDDPDRQRERWDAQDEEQMLAQERSDRVDDHAPAGKNFNWTENQLVPGVMMNPGTGPVHNTSRAANRGTPVAPHPSRARAAKS